MVPAEIPNVSTSVQKYQPWIDNSRISYRKKKGQPRASDSPPWSALVPAWKFSKFLWALWPPRKIGFHFLRYSYHPRRTSWYSGGLVWFPKNFTRTAKVAYLYFPLCCQEKVACAQVAMIISVSPTNQLYSFCVNDSKWNGGACFIRQRWSSIPLTEGSEDRWGLWRYPLTFSVFRRRKSCWEACC